jgi:hypothetical protein
MRKDIETVFKEEPLLISTHIFNIDLTLRRRGIHLNDRELQELNEELERTFWRNELADVVRKR